MDFRRLMKTTGCEPESRIPVTRPITAASDTQQLIPDDVAETIATRVADTIESRLIRGFNCVEGSDVRHTLKDWQVEQILDEVRKLEEKYFTEEDGTVLIPLSDTINESFIYNIPLEIADGIKNGAYANIPLVLSPIWYIYLMLAANPMEGIGVFLQTLSTVIDDNREVVDNDAQEYLADILAPEGTPVDDDDDYDGEDPDDAGSVAEPGEYIEQDSEFDASLFEGCPEIDPDAVDVIVGDDCEVVPIDPAQEDGEIPYDE